MILKRISILILVAVITYGCGAGGKDEPAPNPDPVPVAPVKATLVAPAQNELCNQGTVISATQSTVTLKWNAAANSESYEVTVKNLESGISTTLSTINTQADVALSRNAPYSWQVVSKSSKVTATAQSDSWRFYNSGPGYVSYAPFQAELISPSAGQTVTAINGKITLNWQGSDVDGDIAGYSVYLGNTVTPTLLKNGITAMSIADVAVNASSTYYWKVVTIDSKGNSSDSGISTFKVN